MSSFKDSVERDIDMVFLNLDEFAQLHTIVCEGVVYQNIPCIVIQPMEKRRTTTEVGFTSVSSYRAGGMYKQAMTLHYRRSDLPTVPEQNTLIKVDEAPDGAYLKDWRVREVRVSAGMVRLQLESISE